MRPIIQTASLGKAFDPDKSSDPDRPYRHFLFPYCHNPRLSGNLKEVFNSLDDFCHDFTSQLVVHKKQ